LKKFLAIAVSALFLLGFAASAFAIHAEIPSETQAAVAMGGTQITLGGSIRVRGEYRQDMQYNGAVETDDLAAWDQRVRLSMDAKVSDNLTGFVMLESGNGDTADTWTWGSASSGATGVYTVGNAKRGQVQVLEAWILYTNDLVNVKIGHMPLALGNLLFFDHRKFGDDAIVLFKDIDNLHIAALTAKFNEGSTTNSTICATAVTGVLYTTTGACAVGDTVYSTSTSTNTATADDGDAYVVLAAYKGDGYNISGDITWVDDNSFADTDLYNFGLRADVNIGEMFNVYGDVELQTGDQNLTNMDYSGWATQIGLKADVDPVKLGLEFGYGSGDAWNDTDTDVDTFVTSLSSGVSYITYVHGTRSANVAGAANGISNLTYVKGTVAGSPMEKLDANAAIVWLQASEDYFNAATGTGADDIGVEVDGKISYKLADGLVYWVEGGVLFVDDNYAQANTGVVGQEQDAYAIRHGIELTF
jgi:hypothetical protein